VPKNAYFLEKAVKIAAHLGTSTQNPRWFPAAGGSVRQTPELLLPPTVTALFHVSFTFLILSSC